MKEMDLFMTTSSERPQALWSCPGWCLLVLLAWELPIQMELYILSNLPHHLGRVIPLPWPHGKPLLQKPLPVVIIIFLCEWCITWTFCGGLTWWLGGIQSHSGSGHCHIDVGIIVCGYANMCSSIWHLFSWLSLLMWYSPGMGLMLIDFSYFEWNRTASKSKHNCGIMS